MVQNIQVLLDDIIAESQQLLLLLSSDENYDLSQLGNPEINTIVSSRQQKFELLFNSYHQEELAEHSKLIEHIVQLDQRLVHHANQQKRILKINLVN